jgi:hypothetical protein
MSVAETGRSNSQDTYIGFHRLTPEIRAQIQRHSRNEELHRSTSHDAGAVFGVVASLIRFPAI